MKWTLAALLAITSSGCAAPPAAPPETPPVVPVGTKGDDPQASAPTSEPAAGPDLRATRFDHCNRLITVINRVQEPLKSAAGSDPAALAKLADTLDQVTERVARVRLEDRRLAKLAKAYGALTSELAVATRQTGVALEANDAQKAIEAAQGMRGFSPRESEVVDKINHYCNDELVDDQVGPTEKSCRGDDGTACYRIARHLDHGDDDRAPSLFEQACHAGEQRACARLGKAFLKKDGAPRYPHQPERGVELLEGACGAGWAHACSALAGALDEGLGTTRDPDRAVTLWVQACESGHGDACQSLKERPDRNSPRVEAALTTACDRWGDYSACDALGREKL